MPSNLVALSIGSDKITAAISTDNDGEFEILDVISKRSEGIRKGSIIYGELALKIINELLEELAQRNSCEIKSIYIALSSKDVEIIKSKGKYVSEFQSTLITQREISKAYINGKNIKVNEDQYIVDAIINEFYTKEQGYRENPINLTASLLEVDLDVIVAKKNMILDFKTLFLNTSYEIAGFILGIDSLKHICLQEKLRNKTNVIIDFGAEKVEIAVFENNILQNVGFVGLGAEDITNDLAIVMEREKNTARALKEKYSGNYVSLRKEFAKLEIDDCTVDSDLFYDIIMARIEEIFNYVKKDLESLEIYDRIENIVIFGDGITCFEEISSFIEDLFAKKVILYTNNELNLENSSKITSIAIVKEVYDRLKLVYKEEIFLDKVLMDYKRENESEIKKEIKKEKKKGLSKVLGFLGDIF